MSLEAEEPDYDTALVKVLLNRQNYTNQIINWVFIPWLVYFIVAVTYMSKVGPQFDPETMDVGSIYSIPRAIMWVLLAYMLTLEGFQMYNSRWDYWTDPWNILYLAMYLLNGTIMVQEAMGDKWGSPDEACAYSSICAMLLWLGLFYWLRLFESFGKYVKLIIQTLHDVVQFLVCFFIIIFSFSNALLILNKNITLYDPEAQPYIEDWFSFSFINAIINQYLMSLGEVDAFLITDFPFYYLTWFIFLFGTFIILLTFLNLVVGIMSTTFETVFAQLELSGLIERTQIYADFMPIIRINDDFLNKKFLYIVDTMENFNEDDDEPEQDYEDTEQFKLTDTVQEKVSFLKKDVGGMHLMMIKQFRDITNLQKNVAKMNIKGIKEKQEIMQDLVQQIKEK